MTRRVPFFSAFAIVCALVVAACGGGGGDDDTSGVDANGVTTVTFWHGQNESGKKALDKLVARFNATHPKIRVKATTGGVLADAMLQKVTTALAAGAYPDMAYIFGSDVPQLARSDKVADLTDVVKGAGWDWEGIYAPARNAAIVGGRVRAVPALLDVMAIVYNRKLFKAAGVAEPKAGWTWDDYRATAKQLTDKGKGQFGTGWPAVGDEDTVWRFWPLVWQAGGNVASADGKQAGFGGAPGEKAMSVVSGLTSDKSVYLDTKPGSEQLYQVFLSGKMGMVPTGPWELPDIESAKIDYGVAPMPSFGGPATTISGPDTWMVFDNGAARRKATETFAQWLTQPEQDAEWDLNAGSLPLRPATLEQPAWKRAIAGSAGLQAFIDQLPSGRVRPPLRSYPKVSQAVGQALVAVLLGKTGGPQALQQAVDASDSALSTSAP